MNKKILSASLLTLGIGMLAGCGNTTQANAATPMEHEIVSAALLTDAQASAKYRQALQRKSPISFDPNDVSASLSSFDSLALDSYKVDTKKATSDKTEYANKDEIVYTLPDGSLETINLYYGEVTEKSWTITASATEDDNEESVKLHENGFRSGGFSGLLESDMEIDDYDDDENAEVKGSWKRGLAVIADTEYSFYSEELAITVTEEDGDKETSSFSSFGLFKQGFVLAVEQFEVVEGTERETAYAYTKIDGIEFERFLLTTDSEDNEARLVSVTPTEKIVITRFEKNGKTLYALRVRELHTYKFVGIYERVVTKDDAGVEVVSYKLYSETETDAPTED